jgi:hypothetical protein
MKKTQNLAVLALGILAGSLLTQGLQPTRARAADAPAPGKFSQLNFSASGGDVYFFDHNTGEVWVYINKRPVSLGQLNKLGEPLK